MVQKNKLSLKRIFKDFDQSHKGYLVVDDFRRMVSTMFK